MTSERARLVFVDAVGGGLAALAAGVARKLGHEVAIAATSSAEIKIPPEVPLALKEIGAELPPVQPAGDLTGIDPAAFAYPLYHPGGRPGAPADHPGGRPGAPADHPGGRPGAPADHPGGRPGAPADHPGGRPGAPADHPGGRPGAPADHPGGRPGAPADHPGGRPGAPADTGEGDFERRVAARIARDRIERYLETR